VPQYDGIVSLEQDEVEVVIDLHPDRVHLRAGTVEVGDWGADECTIAHLGEGVYSITAENTSLRFLPRNPRLFEDGLNHGTGYGLSPAKDAGESADKHGRHVKVVPQARGAKETEAPAPKPLTVALFYGLATLTAALAIWALLTIA
jgi:hypothetical protein